MQMRRLKKMPEKFIRAVKEIQKKINKGIIPKYYDGKKSSAYALARKATGYKGTTHHIGLIHPLRKKR
jgi:hypothetical protein